MRTIDLKREKRTLDDLLDLSSSEAVLIQTADGRQYVLEEVDDFEREVAMLGGSEKFMSFLGERSREESTVCVTEIAQDLKVVNA